MSLRFCLLCSLVAFLNSARPLLAEPKSAVADAAEKQEQMTLERLLDSGADVRVPQPDGTTALHWAAYHDDIDLVNRLLESGADASACNEFGVSPLSLACTNGNSAIVELLLKSGADANAMLPSGETALMIAARTGVPGPVQALLKHGANVGAKENHGQTALMWAAAEGNLNVVEILLNAGADYRDELRSGFTPFFFAVREGQTPVVKKFLEAGADVNEIMRPKQRMGRNSSSGTTALLLAIENGHFELADALLQSGADPNKNPSGYTPLHAISWVRKPIRGDGDPPPIGSGNLTSLEIVTRLAAAGADVNARLERGSSGRGRFTTTGSTPFLMAARTADFPFMKLLLELGADPLIPNADNSSPLLAATGVGALGDGDEAAGTEAEVLATISLLLELGADINVVDDNGETVVHGAAYQSWPEVVRLLASRGADVKVWNQPNRWGWSPLMIAEGHRPGNFRPHPDTITAIREVMLAAGVTPPVKSSRPPERNDYSSDQKPQRPEQPQQN